jgi:hypothetical protein
MLPRTHKALGRTRRQPRWFEPLEARHLLTGGPIISEFMASNQGWLEDGDGGSPDWIELFNPGDHEIDLAGYRLTDTPRNLARWTLPHLTLAAGQYLVVFASGAGAEGYVDAAGYLHTNFQLNREGEYLALVAPDTTIAWEYRGANGGFPEQLPNISYGVAQPLPADGGPIEIGYLATPTPGGPNGSAAEVFSGFVADVQFSVDHGFLAAAQVVEITTSTPGATIVYTVDGSVPSLDNGVPIPAAGAAERPIAQVPVSTTTTLRAAAFRQDYLPAPARTRTYIFVPEVVAQGNTPPGYPTGWKSGPQTLPADYEMDPEITQQPAYRDIMDDALLAIPTISIVTDIDNLFDPDVGIYMNPEQRGAAWERPASVELIYPDGRPGFQVDAGLRIQGGASRMPGLSPKHSFRLLFNRDYGDAKLRYPLFGPDAVAEFDTIVLRAGFNQSWIHTNEFQGDNRGRAQYVRDQWAKLTQRAMGNVAPHSNYAHLYLNGLYWGLYNPTERPSAPFAASYFGGDKADYDVINSGSLVDGDLAAFNRLFELAARNLVGDAEYQAVAEMLDIDAFIDYMILNQYGGNLDWDSHNWYAFRRREPGGKFYWIAWDSEFMLIDKLDNVLQEDSGPGGKGPGHLFLQLIENEQFGNRFADRITAHFVGDGALTVDNVIRRWNSLSDTIVDAVVAESARWGDYRRDVDRGLAPLELYERDVQWMAERNRLLNDYFPARGQIVLKQYIEAGLYTDIPVPLFSQDGGSVAPGFELSMNVPSGSIYYTLDGTDPKAGVATTASTTLLSSEAATRALVPANGDLLADWTSPEFNDAGWKTGTTGVGYERRTGYQDLIGLDVNTEMFDKNTTVYIRVPFELDDPATIDRLVLNIKYDDGFVAWLNGVEVARRNAPDPLDWDSQASASRSDRLAVEYEAINVSGFLDRLRPGRNLLAIQGLNGRLRDDDLLIVPELIGGVVTDPGASGSARLYTGPIALTQDTVVRARTSLGGDWSSINEAQFRVIDQPIPLPGDANRDGMFNSSDLTLVFQAGQYEDVLPGNSTWAEGDWNGDGDVTSADIVLAFQLNDYAE